MSVASLGMSGDKDMSTALEPFRLDDRRSFRHPLALMTRLRELGGIDAPVVLRNLSTVGFSGESTIRLTAPTLVALSVPPLGELRARVRWVRDGVIGGEFLERLDPQAVEQVLAHDLGVVEERPES
jgi:hypothetical protein